MPYPTFYDGRGDSATFKPADFTGGGHNEVISAFGVSQERFALAQWSVTVHGAGLYRGRSNDSHDLSALQAEDVVEFEATPMRPWVPGGWVRAESEDGDAWIEGEIESYDAESGSLAVRIGWIAGGETVSEWRILSQGKRGRSLTPKGDWQSQPYEPLSIVRYGSDSYLAPYGAGPGDEPGDSDLWIKIAAIPGVYDDKEQPASHKVIAVDGYLATEVT